MRVLFGGKKRAAAMVLLMLVAGIAVWQRAPILAWHYVNQLAGADEASRESWVARVAALDEAAAPRLLAGLCSADAKACENLEAALVELTGRWAPDDRRAMALVENIKNRFSTFSEAGKRAALQAPIVLLKKCDKAAPAYLSRDAGDLLQTAAAAPELRLSCLILAGALLERSSPGQWRELCRNMALEGMMHAEGRIRAAAIGLVLRGAMREEADLLAKVATLLSDRDVEVRMAALLAVGAARDAVSDDDLLPLLHDPDARAQELCEVALRSRGLSDEHIKLARMITDDSPQQRLQLLHHLRHSTDLDGGVWLRRLSQDNSSAVRAAAVRAVVQQNQFDLRDRLAEMAAQDPSATVRELAGHYLTRANKNAGARDE